MTGNDTVSFDVDGLLLDCDGVLVDSHDSAAVAWNQWAKRWAPGFDFHRDIEHGRRISDLVAELISDPTDLATAVAELKQQELDCATEVGAIAGAHRLLESCPAGSWAVVTSGNRALATARMASAGLPTAAVLITGEDVENGKPFGDPYLLAAQRLRLPPTRCAVFEDAPAGIASARAAGVLTVVGVGPAAAAAPVTLAVADLRDVHFDGHRLDIAGGAILPQSGG
ncbi:HAD-IA family hydrolase [Mycobacterium deserti]|uniref:HAD-IA family hydrolase n=1 Tax=Mycobacterium deserti TaxID=2978347 RepID=A0ABT2MEH1_9MYCO|nr:HAD-IA family hydrolase [Mycobacterium deserti]MCT7659386.1 HAD-IA family hydrolase [Mycobacterium deserti]